MSAILDIITVVSFAGTLFFLIATLITLLED